MNQDLLRVFETESDYDSAKPDFVYPTVSYVRDVDDVRYMEKTLPILPEYDTTGLATHFIPDEYYANVIPLFQQIYNQYGDNVEILTDTQTLQYENGETVQIYVGDEPLYQNYLSKLTYNVNETEFSVKRIDIPTFGKEVWMSDGNGLHWYVLINMTTGQCTKMRME